MEIFWVLMCVFALRQPGYLILCVMGFAFTGTNINGYWKCRSWSSNTLPESQQSSLNTGMPGIPAGISQGAASALMQACPSCVNLPSFAPFLMLHLMGLVLQPSAFAVSALASRK